jgi:hypothetical protein
MPPPDCSRRTASRGKLRLRLGGSSTPRYPQKKEELNFEPMLDYKLPNIASGATPIGSAERAPDKDEMIDIEEKKRVSIQNFDYIIDKLKIRDYSHQERVFWLLKPEYFQSKFDCDVRFSSCVIATKLECRDLSRR